MASRVLGWYIWQLWRENGEVAKQALVATVPLNGSQRLYSIQISIKIQRRKGERNLPKNRFVYCFLESLPLILKTLASLNPSPCR